MENELKTIEVRVDQDLVDQLVKMDDKLAAMCEVQSLKREVDSKTMIYSRNNIVDNKVKDLSQG